MKRTEISNLHLEETPLDDTNVMTDVVFGNLFDEADTSSVKNENVGFICGYASYAIHLENELRISCINKHGNSGFDWFNTIVERLTGNDYEDVSSLLFIGDYNVIDESSGLVLSFRVMPQYFSIKFYANV